MYDVLIFIVECDSLCPYFSNLVKFYNSWEDRGRLYQQFELCKGNLQDLGSKEGRLAEDVIWGYMVDLLKALQHLHEHDLVHMDIKPENIFIGRESIRHGNDL